MCVEGKLPVLATVCSRNRAFLKIPFQDVCMHVACSQAGLKNNGISSLPTLSRIPQPPVNTRLSLRWKVYAT